MKKSHILVSIVLFYCQIGHSKVISPKDFFRMQECIRMKSLVGQKYWDGLEKFVGPWGYVTKEGQYLINSKLIKGFETVVPDEKAPSILEIFVSHESLYRAYGQQNC
jgi:hypothetical protein